LDPLSTPNVAENELLIVYLLSNLPVAMADVRSLLKSERASRRIAHPHATYSTTGNLVCLVCNIQIKSESLWNGHLRSPQHAMKLQRIRDANPEQPVGAPVTKSQQGVGTEEGGGFTEVHADGTHLSTGESEVRSKKRKANDSDSDEDTTRKRSKAGGLPDGFFDEHVLKEEAPDDIPTGGGQETRLPSRPATPLKTPPSNVPATKLAAVDEDEWAAFEADIAAAEAPIVEDFVISAAPISASELAAKSRQEESAQQKERQEAEMEGDKEDAARKLEDEFEEMEELESKVRRLKEKREMLRLKGDVKPSTASVPEAPVAVTNGTEATNGSEEEDEDDEDDDNDDWDGFRFKA
jgi:zinc finger protein 830